MADTTNVGAIAIEILARTEKLEKNMQEASSKIAMFGGMVAGTTAAVANFAFSLASTGATAFMQYGAATIEAIDAGAKLADQLNVTLESLRGLQHGGALAGSSAEQVGSSLKKLAKQLGEVRSGNVEATETFNQLGLDGMKLSELPIDQAFGKIAQAISEIQNPADRAKAAMDVFGKSGQDLLPMMAGGAEGLRKMQQEFQSLGGNMTRLDAAKLENVNDALEKAKVQIGNSASKLVANFSEEIVGAARWMGNLAVTAESAFGHISSGLKTILNEWSAWDTAIVGVEASLRRVTQNSVADLDAAWTKMKATLKEQQEWDDGEWMRREDTFGGKLKPHEQAMLDESNALSKKQREKEAADQKKIQDDLAKSYAQKMEAASQDMAAKAASWIEATETPMDKWVNQMKEINELRLAGKLTDEQALNAAYKATDALDKATMPEMNKTPVGFGGQIQDVGGQADAFRMAAKKPEDPQLKVTNALLLEIVQQGKNNRTGAAVTV